MADKERRSDTAETFGSQEPPQATSDQNAEEEPAPSGSASSERSSGHRDSADEDAGRQDQAPESGTAGGAGEHSQATGSPDSAG